MTLTEGTEYEIAGNQRGDVYNEIVIRTINTVDAADTIDVDLTKYGISATGLIGVRGWKHTTANSTSVAENAETSVSSGTVTLTVPSGTDDDPRFYIIKGFAVPNPAASL